MGYSYIFRAEKCDDSISFSRFLEFEFIIIIIIFIIIIMLPHFSSFNNVFLGSFMSSLS